jgi:hypothetical protein
VPDNLLECDVRFYDSNPLGAVDVDLDFVPDFLGTGERFDPGRFVGDIYQVGGSGTPVSTYSGDILPKTDRYIANLLLNFNVTDSINFFAQGKYARIDSETENQPTFDFFLRVRPDNAFLNPTLSNALRANRNTFGALVNRDNFDLGRRGQAARRQTYRGVLGLTAEMTENIRLDLAYVYGRTTNDTTQTNNRFNDRFFAALDAVRDPATGNIVCRSNIAPVTGSNQNFGGPNFTAFNFLAPPNGTVLSFTPGPNSGCVPFNLLQTMLPIRGHWTLSPLPLSINLASSSMWQVRSWMGIWASSGFGATKSGSLSAPNTARKRVQIRPTHPVLPSTPSAIACSPIAVRSTSRKRSPSFAFQSSAIGRSSTI